MAIDNTHEMKLCDSLKVQVSGASADPQQYRSAASSKMSPKGKSPTKFGKANPVRDAILLVFFFGIFIFISGEHKPVKEASKDLDVPSPRTLLDRITELAMEAAKKRRKTPCNIFLYNGSIPNSGLSYFAGRDFETGELLLEDFSAIPLKEIYVAPSAFILKHHPLLFNVQGVLYYNDSIAATPSSFELRASRPIAVGDELFAKYDVVLHNHSLFRDIPSDSDYNLTAVIVKDALRSVYDHKTRDGRHICSMTPVMKFTKQSIARFNPLIAGLLPSSSTTSGRFRTMPPSVAVLKNQTLNNLQQSAFCLDDVPPVYDSLGRRASSLEINIERGTIVVTLPDLTTPRSADVCDAEQDTC